MEGGQEKETGKKFGGLETGRTRKRSLFAGSREAFTSWLRGGDANWGATLGPLPPRAAHDTPRLLFSAFAVLQDLDAIHPYMPDAGRVLVRLLICRMLGNRLWIERNDVGEVAGNELAAVLNPQGCRRERRQLPNRFLKRNDVLVTHVLAEVAISTRMRARLQEHALRRHRRRVGSKADPRQLDLPLHIVLRHQKVHHLHAASILRDEIHGCILQ